MKNTLRVVSIVMVVVMLCVSLASCAKTVSGKYKADYYGSGIAMIFDGSNVEIEITAVDMVLASIDASYTIEEEKISFNFDDAEKITNVFAKAFIDELQAPVSFAEGDGYIEIDGIKYVEAAE